MVIYPGTPPSSDPMESISRVKRRCLEISKMDLKEKRLVLARSMASGDRGFTSQPERSSTEEANHNIPLYSEIAALPQPFGATRSQKRKSPISTTYSAATVQPGASHRYNTRSKRNISSNKQNANSSISLTPSKSPQKKRTNMSYTPRAVANDIVNLSNIFQPLDVQNYQPIDVSNMLPSGDKSTRPRRKTRPANEKQKRTYKNNPVSASTSSDLGSVVREVSFSGTMHTVRRSSRISKKTSKEPPEVPLGALAPVSIPVNNVPFQFASDRNNKPEEVCIFTNNVETLQNNRDNNSVLSKRTKGASSHSEAPT